MTYEYNAVNPIANTNESHHAIHKQEYYSNPFYQFFEFDFVI